MLKFDFILPFFTAPNGRPTDLRLTATSSTSITMSWSPPPAVNQRGVLTYYAIRWRKGWATYKQFNTDGVVLTYHFDNLIPNQVYRFRIAAATKAGIGPYITWTAKTTLEAGEYINACTCQCLGKWCSIPTILTFDIVLK